MAQFYLKMDKNNIMASFCKNIKLSNFMASRNYIKTYQDLDIFMVKSNFMA